MRKLARSINCNACTGSPACRRIGRLMSRSTTSSRRHDRSVTLGGEVLVRPLRIDGRTRALPSSSIRSALLSACGNRLEGERPWLGAASPSKSPPRARACWTSQWCCWRAAFASTAIGPIEVFHSAGVLWNWLHGATRSGRAFACELASVDGKKVNSLARLRPGAALLDPRRPPDRHHRRLGFGLGTEGPHRARHLAAAVAAQVARHRAPTSRHVHRRHLPCRSGPARRTIGHHPLGDGRQAPGALSQGAAGRPRQFVTEDGHVMCSGGVYAAIDLSLYLVEKFCGHEIALQCAPARCWSALPRGCQSGYAMVPLSRPHDDEEDQAGRGLAARSFRPRRADRPAGRARRHGLAQLHPSLQGRHRPPPGPTSRCCGLSAARELLERGTPSIQTVCSKVGYEDVAFFRRLFRRHTGMAPAEYRARFCHP